MPPDRASLDELVARLRTWHKDTSFGSAAPPPRARVAPTPGDRALAGAEALREARTRAKAQKSAGPMASASYRAYYEAMVLELKEAHPDLLDEGEGGYIYGTAHQIAKRHQGAIARRGRCQERGCIRANHNQGKHMNAAGQKW